jgi:hypothetical protein
MSEVFLFENVPLVNVYPEVTWFDYDIIGSVHFTLHKAMTAILYFTMGSHIHNISSVFACKIKKTSRILRLHMGGATIGGGGT